MAYTPNTLYLALAGGGPLGVNLWVYDTVDAFTDVDATGYFTLAGAPAFGHKGMEVGDLVIVRVWDTAVPTTTALKAAATLADKKLAMVSAVNSTTGAATVVVFELPSLPPPPPPPGP